MSELFFAKKTSFRYIKKTLKGPETRIFTSQSISARQPSDITYSSFSATARAKR
jgi:hypothetical protein